MLKTMDIKINDKNKQTLVGLLQQRDAIMAQFEQVVCLILDAKDVEYKDKEIDFDLENNLIKLKEHGES